MNAITSYKQYGISRSQVASLCINFFHYPEAYKDTLEEYYILHWTGDHFKRTLKYGVISREASYSTDIPVNLAVTTGIESSCNKVEYLVVYQGCTPYQAARAKQLKLSFRKPKSDFHVCGYVIVKLADAAANDFTHTSPGSFTL